MIGKAKRLITEEKVLNAVCTHCKEQNTLKLKVYSNFFMLKVLPFVLGKSTELICTNCKKAYGQSDTLDTAAKRRIDILKEDANHAWFLYIGYGFIGLAIIGVILKDL